MKIIINDTLSWGKAFAEAPVLNMQPYNYLDYIIQFHYS